MPMHEHAGGKRDESGGSGQRRIQSVIPVDKKTLAGAIEMAPSKDEHGAAG